MLQGKIDRVGEKERASFGLRGYTAIKKRRQ
jgi:hypothetical protein